MCNYYLLNLNYRLNLSIYVIITFQNRQKDFKMIKKEMIENFGVTRKTLNNWENEKDSKRYILYKTLEALPVEYVDNVKKQIKEQEENDRLLDK